MIGKGAVHRSPWKYMKQTAVILIVTLIVGIAVAISLHIQGPKQSSMLTPSSSTSSEITPNTITISNYRFKPQFLTIKKGTTVTWNNMDIARHTVTADQSSKDAPSSQFFGQGESYSYTFNTAGTYTYHCEPHPYMKATITVIE